MSADEDMCPLPLLSHAWRRLEDRAVDPLRFAGIGIVRDGRILRGGWQAIGRGRVGVGVVSAAGREAEGEDGDEGEKNVRGLHCPSPFSRE